MDILSLYNSLTEGKQVGPLYHFTHYRSMIRIIESGFVLKNISEPRYVSFTRNKNMKSNTIPQNVRITVNGDILSNLYKIEPYADTAAGYGRMSISDESEERISLERYPQGINISKALMSIDVRNPNYASDFDDEESVEPPSLNDFIRLTNKLKSDDITFNIVNSFEK